MKTYFRVRQQYPFVFLPIIDRESADRCFLYAYYGNPYLSPLDSLATTPIIGCAVKYHGGMS